MTHETTHHGGLILGVPTLVGEVVQNHGMTVLSYALTVALMLPSLLKLVDQVLNSATRFVRAFREPVPAPSPDPVPPPPGPPDA